MDNQEQAAPAADGQAQQPDQGQAQGGQQGGGNPAQVIMGVQKALAGMASAIQGSPLPKEGIQHLENAMKEYNAFVSIVGKSLGIQMPEADEGSQQEEQTDQSSGENQSMEAAGNKNAVPVG